MALTRSPGVRGETSTNGATPHDMRRAMEALLGASGPGVLTGCTVTGTSSWQYAVSAGFLATRRASGDGMNVWSNDDQYLVDTDPAPGAGARVDIVYAVHHDGDQADPDSMPVIDVAIGEVDAGPPSLPAGAVELARKTVSSGDANTAAGAEVSESNRAYAGDTGWIDVPGVGGSFTTTRSRIRRVRGGMIEYTGSFSGAVPDGENTELVASGGIPEFLRPNHNEWGSGFLSGSYPCVAWATSAGEVRVLQRTGAARSNPQFTIVWTR